MQRRGGTLVGLVVGTSLLVACSDAGGEAEGPSSSPPSSSSSVSSGPGGGESSSAPVVPVVPEAARGGDDAAAVAFVEHWVELLNYGLATGDSAPVAALVDSQCLTCTGLVNEIEESGGPEAEGQWTASELRSKPSTDDEADIVVTAQITIEGQSRKPYGTATFGLARGSSGWSVAWMTAEAAQ